MSRDSGATPSVSASGSILFGLTILFSAFLLFQVQPIIGKAVLPWFGGSPAVWTTCMLFFQMLLLAGYAYAHWSIGRLRSRPSVVLHTVLLGAALFTLPIIPSDAWKPGADVAPVAHILLLLFVSVGLPYFLLSTTGPLVQAWYYRWSGGSTPYHLYALSNVGSLGALLTYPVLVEPTWGTVRQGQIWSLGFLLFAVCCAAAGWLYERRERLGGLAGRPPLGERTEGADGGGTAEDVERAEKLERPVITTDETGLVGGAAPGPVQYVMWVGLPALASVMLLAVTAHISQDVAVFPFLWILPLALYLTSFIVAFSHNAFYRPVANALLLLLVLGIMALLQHAPAWNVWIADQVRTERISEWLGEKLQLPRFMNHLWLEVSVYAAALFYLCMLCHGEVVHRKPDAKHLTAFYLMIAAGGAIGGFLVAVVFPRVFHTHAELLIGWLLALVAALACILGRLGGERRGRGLFVAGLIAVVAGPAIAWGLWNHWHDKWYDSHVVDARRNFFGVLQVYELGRGGGGHRRELLNGRILHGVQLLGKDELRVKPTTYFSEESGIGVSVKIQRRNGPLRVGTIGLGAGTIAAYGEKGDYFTFYEINPQVIEVNRKWFSFLADMRARGGRVDVKLGDARLTLERQAPQQFDVLAIDAFTGDAIPAHLLTCEAFAVYLKHMKRDGVIAVHISNRHLDLKPVVAAAAAHYRLRMLRVYAHDHGGLGEAASDWLLLTASGEFCDAAVLFESATEVDLAGQRKVAWTDDFSSIWQIMGTADDD